MSSLAARDDKRLIANIFFLTRQKYSHAAPQFRYLYLEKKKKTKFQITPFIIEIKFCRAPKVTKTIWMNLRLTCSNSFGIKIQQKRRPNLILEWLFPRQVIAINLAWLRPGFRQTKDAKAVCYINRLMISFSGTDELRQKGKIKNSITFDWRHVNVIQ